MFRFTKNNSSIILGFSLILFYYLIIILKNNLDNGSFYFLSISIVSDNSYLNLILKKEIPFIEKGINFSFIPFVIERMLIYIFGFDNVWVMLIIYKLISFLIISLGFKKLLKLKNNSFLVYSIVLALLFCIDFPPFNDKYPRPLFSNIFIFSIFISNLHILKGCKFNNRLNFLYGFLHGLAILTNPWALLAIFPMSLFSSLKNINYSRLIYAAIGFLILIIPVLTYFLSNSVGSMHAEYLGLKVISNSMAFYKDYIFSITGSKQFIILFVLLLTSSFILKKYEILFIFCLCLLLNPVVFLIFGKSVQSYNLVNSLKNLQVLFTITLFLHLLKEGSVNIFKIKITKLDKILVVIFILSAVSLITYLGNSWVDRSEDNKKKWEQNRYIFNYLENLSTDCILISNNDEIKEYWSSIRNGEVFPKDGFINTSRIEDTLDELKFAIDLLNKLEPLSQSEVSNMLKFSTHNYYASTRSTSAPSLSFNNDEEKISYFLSRNTVNSMQPWRLVPPDYVYEYLMGPKEIKVDANIHNNMVIVYKNEKDFGSNFKIMTPSKVHSKISLPNKCNAVIVP